MKLKLILSGLVFGLGISSCAHAPATQIVDIPIATQAKHIDLKPCPELPINQLTTASTWDQRLSAWYASLTIQQGCIKARDQIIQEINK